MNKLLLPTRVLLAAIVLFVALPVSAYQNVWVRAEAYPTGSGTVYVDWSPIEDGIYEYDDVSEFKRAANNAVSDAFIATQVAPGYQLAGFVRDDGNQRYDNGVDVQIRVRNDGYFTAVYDHTEYGEAGSTSAAQAEAEMALADMTAPTDYIFAVFTQGDVARPAEGQEMCGWVYCSKLDNEPGDEITLDAYGDSDNSTGELKYYKFDHWTDETGNIISYDRVITVTALGASVYYANFIETDRDNYNTTEKNKNPHNETAIRGISASSVDGSNQYFDLNGRTFPFGTTHRGVYIHDGNKYIKK